MTIELSEMQLHDLKMEKINLDRDYPLPPDYLCKCKYCKQYKGLLIRKDGSMYNKNDRRKYYIFKQGEGGSRHCNPTPLHIARWAIQTLTKEDDWVLDPFLGSGTSAVEALNHGRNIIGTEIQTAKLVNLNVLKNHDTEVLSKKTRIYEDSAANIGTYLDGIQPIQLIIGHPPYSGDEGSANKYDRDIKDNFAFLKEGPEYWNMMKRVFGAGIDHLATGGYVVMGIKEMMRNKKWWDLHIKLNNLIESFPEMKFSGTILLPHYPATLHMNTYEARWGSCPPKHQTISIFKKG